MKYYTILTPACLLLALSGSGHQSDKHCINEISISDSVQSGEHTISLPDGKTFSGAGALPFKVTIGKYHGIMSSVVTSQIPSETGMDVELVHLFEDTKGNSFWTSDKATMIPTDDPSGAIMRVDDTMTVVGGTGDFKCARGIMKNTGTINFITSSMQVNLSGRVCLNCK